MSENLEIQGVGQIAIAVSDLERAMNFYKDVLDLPLLFEASPGLAFFDCGGIRLMLTTQQGPEEDHHTSVIYYRVEDIKKATSVLTSRDVTFVRKPQVTARLEDHELWMGFIRDPDENLIGIMSEVPFKEDSSG